MRAATLLHRATRLHVRLTVRTFCEDTLAIGTGEGLDFHVWPLVASKQQAARKRPRIETNHLRARVATLMHFQQSMLLHVLPQFRRLHSRSLHPSLH